MIPIYKQERLKQNWGERADSLMCFAEVRFYDPQSAWQCYVYAMNPDYPDEIACMIRPTGFHDVEVCDWSMQELQSMYNSHGEGVEIDREYRPKLAIEILKQLRDKSL